ncbi:MAG: phosphatase PAP2 family protein [Ignavibacteria bacterium]|nr:phosphatase PAP2 family protein [Ignavibacteria bacterium]
MNIKLSCIIITLLLGYSSYSQDTINFKLFDSLKTKSEDSHKKVTTVPQNSGDSITIPIPLEPTNFDVRLFRSINNSRSPLKTKVLNTFDNSMLPVALMLPPSLFIYSRVKRNTYDENSAYLLFSSEFTNFAVTFGIKTFFKRARPLNALKNVHSKGMPILDVYSFPSGHTSTTFAMATMFALRYPDYPQVYAPMYVWGFIIAYARPYFGMHYPSDLLAGALIGTGSSVLVYSLRKELFRFKNQVLGEDKTDEGSVNGGVLTFFGAAFAISAIFDNFIFKEDPGKRFFISPWMDNKRGGLNVKWKL